MRLTCPNCNAQYEVDEKVIPQNGRDVQCSACGHTWYQYPLEVALQMRAAETEDDDDDEIDTPPPPPSDGTGRATAPRIDKTVLDVLREEADREMSERARTRNDLETQGDLGLTRPARATVTQARTRRDDENASPPPAPGSSAAAGKEDPVRRRNLLPDIEELTSTLEPGTETRRTQQDDPDAPPTPDKRGFRNGLSVVLLIAMFLLAIYMLAPLIADSVPALADPLTIYVGFIDGLRMSVSGLLRNVMGG